MVFVNTHPGFRLGESGHPVYNIYRIPFLVFNSSTEFTRCICSFCILLNRRPVKVYIQKTSIFTGGEKLAP